MTFRASCRVLLCFALADPGAPNQQTGTLVPAVEQLDLEAFDDDDCLEAPYADTLLQLLHEMCDLLDRVLLRRTSWQAFNEWADVNTLTMTAIARSMLNLPYCEPFKVSWLASECLLVLRDAGDGEAKALECAAALDEDIYAQMTPPVRGYNTRLHLVFRSPWPTFRLLDLLVRLHPETGSLYMGACLPFRNALGDPDAFDWPQHKSRLSSVVDVTVEDPSVFELRPEDGPLSRQYIKRWRRVYEIPGMKDVMASGLEVAENYKPREADRAGCHLGVTSSHVLELLLAHLRDVDGHLHRLTLVVAQLINFLAPIGQAVRSDWPLFRLLHFTSLLQRRSPSNGYLGSEPRAKAGAVRHFCSQVDAAVEAWGKKLSRARNQGDGCTAPAAFITSAWGALSTYSESVLKHWAKVFEESKDCAPLLLFLAADEDATQQCHSTGKRVQCVDVPQRFGVEPIKAKYLALASVARRGVTATWLDLDVYMLADPRPVFSEILATSDGPDIIFAQHLTTDSLSPALVVARGSERAVELLLRYARWLHENPFLLDHRGWDQFLGHRSGDHAGGFDYKGRAVEDDGGPNMSFVPESSFAPLGVRFSVLPQGVFGSGDGWRTRAGGSLVLFHFWGASESQADLFERFYNTESWASSNGDGLEGIPEEAASVIQQYRRQPAATPTLKALLASGRPLYLVSVTYASGCCRMSLQKNRRQALAVGVDDARAYGRKDLGPAWVEKNAATLAQKTGGGWWLWKPYLIRNALLDPAVPWGRGVIIYVDAGNFLHADPRSLVTSALQGSDVAALRLKACLEGDWTSAATLRQLNVSARYVLVDQPQLGAYLLFFRKTAISIAFVEEWLRLAEDPLALQGGASEDEAPGFQKHQADQSIFSLLFKSYGFRAMTLEEGHSVVTLARWRE